MPKRIPHTDMEIITGTQTTQDYLAMQKKLGRFYFKDFFSRIDGLAPSGRFLEIGPGPGYQTGKMAKRYRPEEIVGLEVSPDMVKIAREYIGQTSPGSRIRFIQGAVEDSGVVEGLGRFDLIYSSFSLHHWVDPIQGIANLYGALKEKGVLFIYDFFRGGIFYYIQIKRGIWESIRAAYTPEELENFLKDLNIGDYTIDRKSLYLCLTAKKHRNCSRG